VGLEQMISGDQYIARIGCPAIVAPKGIFLAPLRLAPVKGPFMADGDKF
jgi:hypothetical protein